jgi:hypothetical protein
MNFHQQRAHGPQGDPAFNGWLTAMRGLIAKAQVGVCLHPEATLVAAPIPNGPMGRRSMTPERTAHGDLAPRR